MSPGLPTVNDPAEIGLRLVLGALATYAGFGAGGHGRLAPLYAKVFGVAYLLLGLVGFVLPDLIPGVIHLYLGCNVLHLALGVWGIWAGYRAGRPGGGHAGGVGGIVQRRRRGLELGGAELREVRPWRCT